MVRLRPRTVVVSALRLLLSVQPDTESLSFSFCPEMKFLLRLESDNVCYLEILTLVGRTFRAFSKI